MKRLKFDPQGKIVGVDGKFFNGSTFDVEDEDDFDAKDDSGGGLKTSDSLAFLKDDSKLQNNRDSEYWSLYAGERRLDPLKFSNGKSQEDIVKETVDLIKAGKKVIFIHGVCGTGKSAIALNVARVLGKTSVVVPIKTLPKQ